MALHERAGTLPIEADIISIDLIISKYYNTNLDLSNPSELVQFGTSGHRGSSLKNTFTEAHILAITQAVCDIRKEHGIHGPLFMGKDTHALSQPAFDTALEVLVANEVYVAIQKNNGYTPTPAISHAIIKANAHKNNNDRSLADGIVITPSHNPPSDGGFKYNPPHGGPADTNITKKIETRANALLANDNKEVKRISIEKAKASSYIILHDYIEEYVNDISKAIDMSVISDSKVKIGVDPLGGSSIDFWEPMAEKYKLNLTLVSKEIDTNFKMIPLDHDGKIRMDCSSKYVMSGLLKHKDNFDIAFGTDPDADRHGIVCKQGLVPANHYLSVATDYLLNNRPLWTPILDSGAAIGKTVVTTSMLDRIAKKYKRNIFEVPVGFKYFVDGLSNQKLILGCEESAGASFLCFDGSPWSTDKDGLLLCLLSAEIFAKTGKNPYEYYKNLEELHGIAHYERIDMPASESIRAAFKNFSPENIKATTVANEQIDEIITKTSGNNENFGGFKIKTENAWFATRPSGTENICKIYMESFSNLNDFSKLQEDAQDIVNALID